MPGNGYLKIGCWCVVLYPKTSTLSQNMSLQVAQGTASSKVNHFFSFILLTITDISFNSWLSNLLVFNKPEVRNKLVNFNCPFEPFKLRKVGGFCIFFFFLFSLFFFFIFFFSFWTAQVSSSCITCPFSSTF